MKTSTIIHKNEERIKIEFPFNQEIVSKIRQIPDARWSRTLGVWHIPSGKDTYNQLIHLFPDIEIPQLYSDETISATKLAAKTEIVEKGSPIPARQSFTNKNEIAIELSGKSIFLKMPKNETDIQFIRTFQYVRWDNAHFRWVVPNYGKNLELIKNYFNTRITRIETRIPEQPKAVPHFTSTIIVTDLPRIDSESLQEIEWFSQWMKQKRYSESTVKTYIMAITVFLRFIKPKTSAEATNEEMQRFVYQYMIPRKLSFSYQNQAVNAARLFFNPTCSVFIKNREK